MQVILLENIMKLGKIGEQVEVKNGYGRNYLLRQGKALRASKENIEFVGKKKSELNKKNEESKKQFKESQKYLAGGVSSHFRMIFHPVPLTYKSAKGSKLTDIDGNEYIDYVSGLLPIILGYCDPDIDSKIIAQLNKGIYC